MARTGIVTWILLALWLLFATQVEIGGEPWAKNDPKIALSPSPIKALHSARN